MKISRLVGLGIVFFAAAGALQAGDWLHWRGPQDLGIAEPGQNPPAEFSDSENVVWKTAVPGRGHSSPTIIGDKVILTTADKEKQTQSVLCFDRKTGKELWATVVNSGGLPREIHSKNTHASPTVACDGKELFAVFNNNDSVQLAALDLNGKLLWKKQGPFLPEQYKFGYAPSPLLYDNLVILAAEYEKGYIVALNKKNGSIAWKIDRPQISFSSPIVAKIGGRDQMLISGLGKVSSFDPKTGKLLWAVDGPAVATCGTLVWLGDTVFASGGYPEKETIAVKADGSGKVLWRQGVKCYEQSMLASDGYVYAVTDEGIAYCWNAETGEEMWKRRLGGSVSSSPTLVGDKIYLFNERGKCFVFKANPEKFELLAENQLGDEAFASPSFCEGQMFMRTADSSSGTRLETLYCIGQ
ncbi:PQQ-binding-like beta-propeller repeat protein [Blastopirellula sp. JC732]|uniref:PQQ-binding-like beta-propeller repeat protein n=1 Tax=Blastopirellula sediminis TaxID=2894196 RepID=A0A9X1MMT0_9BACT|nr:PQQ-binding-like beta-propeller repeat protein [Blastopirellula sediminis]MCC9607178.1 PQQ-binding-like beta-propeller repeat protein [Blastopirellula sediminis]MCC9629529.1 PQQ-binding-like beta-propeller repeat protein [Blastopirellula sediminis]